MPIAPFFILLLFGLALAENYSIAEKERTPQAQILMIEKATAQWDNFKSKYDKHYANDIDERRHRRAFVKNYVRVERHNAQNGHNTYEMKINSFSDMLPEELHTMHGRRPALTNRSRSAASLFIPQRNAELPDSIDWREKGVVSRVKDQGVCGSCWAFGTIGAVEGAQAKATGKLVELSEQNLVDCSGSFGNSGCSGGLSNWAFDYIIHNQGIDTEASYPYVAKDSTCVFNKSSVGARVKSYVNITEGDETALKAAVATVGPVTVAIFSNINFHLYNRGIFYDRYCLSDDFHLNHEVLVVGYDSDHWLGDFWIVKNSWGRGWGEDGYIRMARNRGNLCGVATSAQFPIV